MPDTNGAYFVPAFSGLQVLEWELTSQQSVISHAHICIQTLVWKLQPKNYGHRESYMSVHVLLNLLDKLVKSNKMWGLPSILSLFLNDHESMILFITCQKKNLRMAFLAFKRQDFAIFYARFNEHHYVTLLICKPLLVYRFYHMTSRLGVK